MQHLPTTAPEQRGDDEREARATFDAGLFAQWGKRDPIGLFETFLINGSVDLESGLRQPRTADMRERNAEILRRAEQRVIAEVEQAAVEALESRTARMPLPESARTGVYSDSSTTGETQFASIGSQRE